jgi:MYXO-CTERM domain-containing protein
MQSTHQTGFKTLENKEMKKFMLTAAGIASVALAGSATADVVVAFNVDGPGGNGVQYDGVGGAAGAVAIDLDFINAGGWSYAGDLLIGFIDSNGNGVEYGGYNMTLGYSSVGDFGSSWDSSSSGSWSGTIDLSGSGLSDVASVIMVDGYSNGASTDNWNGTLTFGDVPAPGALALLGLAGFAGRRRRR